jgi:hypothetical protein
MRLRMMNGYREVFRFHPRGWNSESKAVSKANGKTGSLGVNLQ